MRVLVTGGLGFAGSWIARHLARTGHEVWVSGRAVRDKSSLPDIGLPYRYLSLDVTDPPESLASALPEVDAVVHAASSNDAHLADYGAHALAVNAGGTRNLLEAVRLLSMRPAFVYLSTFHVYGAESGDVDEDHIPAPRTEYALTHLAAEEYCRMYRRVHDIPATVLRLANGYGAPLVRPFGKWYLLIPDLCRMAVRDRHIALRSPGNIRRDFLWLGDVAAIVEALVPFTGQEAGPLNVASGQSRSIAELAALAAERCRMRYGFLPDITVGPDRPEAGLRVSTARLQRLMPKFAFHDAMAAEMDAIFAVLDAEEEGGVP